MDPRIAAIFTTFLYILLIAIVIRALMSWFPVSQNNPFARVLYQFTEPLLEPVRRVMPRFGMIDFSALAVIILLYIMIGVINSLAD